MMTHCPICKQETQVKGNPFRPFCSERCKLIDLGNWLGERYRISQPAENSSNQENEQREPDGAEDGLE